MTALDEYRRLGESGLRVSPLALGTMTFGETWGAPEEECRQIFDTYLDRGGNFIDTATYYAGGASEEMVGRFAQGRRDELVLATKYSLARQSHANGAGNSRKSMMLAVEESLRRLKTDYIDLYFLHIWDGLTPADEVLRAFDDLVRTGKVLYVGLSDTPAWQVARLQTMAELRGWSRFAALQIEYNLLQRSVERDLVAAAAALGIGVLPWSPLASGRLGGKYARSSASGDGRNEGRTALLEASNAISAGDLDVADLVKDVADRIGATSAQVAIAWLLTNPAVTAPITGIRTMAQFEDTFGALELKIPEVELELLKSATMPAPGFPELMYKLDFVRHALTGGNNVRGF